MSLGVRKPRPWPARAARGPSWLIMAVTDNDWLCCGGMIRVVAVYIAGSKRTVTTDKTIAAPTNLRMKDFRSATMINGSGKRARSNESAGSTAGSSATLNSSFALSSCAMNVSNSSREYRPDPSGSETKLSHDGRPVSQSAQGSAPVQLYRHNNGISGHEPDRAKTPAQESVVLLFAHRGTVGTNDEFASGIGAPAGTAGQPQVVGHSLAGLVDKGAAVIDGP